MGKGESMDAVGLFMIGIGVGLYIPHLPEPASILQPFLGLIFVIIGILLMIRK